MAVPSAPHPGIGSAATSPLGTKHRRSSLVNGKFVAAPVAAVFVVVRSLYYTLEKSLLSVAIAFCTKVMNRFVAAHVFLYNVSRHMRRESYELIPLLLAVPFLRG